MNEIHSEITGHRVKLLEDGGILLGHVKLYTFDTAITANVTTTDAAAGSIGITTHATGKDKFFFSDGAKWQNVSLGTAAVADAVAAAGAATAASLTDNSGGAASTTLAAVGGAYSQTVLANAIASLAAQHAALLVDAAALRTQLNLVITKLKAAGLMAT